MLDTIELTIYRSDDKPGRGIHIVRAHITQWWENFGGTFIRTTCGDELHVSQSYALVTHLLTSDESEDADHGALDPQDFKTEQEWERARTPGIVQWARTPDSLEEIIDPRD